MRSMLALGLCVALAGLAPDVASAGSLRCGVKGGLNIANLSFDNSAEELADSRTGMAIGGFLAFAVTDMFSISPEALYTMKGDSEELTEQGTTVKLTAKLDYIEIPVLARVDFTNTSSITPWLAAGPALAFNVNAKIKGEASDGTTSGSAEIDIGDIIKSVDFGAAFGGGLTFGLGDSGKNVGVEFRYTLGLTDVVEGTFDDQGNVVKTGTSDGKTQTISIMASVGFD